MTGWVALRPLTREFTSDRRAFLGFSLPSSTIGLGTGSDRPVTNPDGSHTSRNSSDGSVV